MSTAADAASDVPQRIAALRAAWLEEWAPKLTSDATPINPYRVIAELNRAGGQGTDDHHPRCRQPA